MTPPLSERGEGRTGAQELDPAGTSAAHRKVESGTPAQIPGFYGVFASQSLSGSVSGPAYSRYFKEIAEAVVLHRP